MAQITEAPSRGQNPRVIDGNIRLEIDDSSHVNSGCILNYGRIAIRCMPHTSVVFRNVRVFSEKLPFAEIGSH